MHCSSSLLERLNMFRIKTAEDYIVDIDKADLTDTDSDAGESDTKPDMELNHLLEIKESDPAPIRPTVVTNNLGWSWFGGIVGQNTDIGTATKEALTQLEGMLSERGLQLSHLVSVSLYVRDMKQYSTINSNYSSVIGGTNPPVRVCLGTGLNEETPVILSALAYARSKHTMHVQSLSHWAPANIGPYSQAVRVGDIIYIAGQIGMVPGSLTLVSGGIRRQCRLALRHVGRLIKAMDKDTQLRDVVQGVCYVTNASYICEARKEWERRTNNAIVEYVVVPELPKGALVEWQIWAHRGNTGFDYEETGCVVGENRVSLRRRWNYDNTVSAVVCYVSAISSVSNPVISDSNSTGCDPLSDSQLYEVFRYAIARLYKGVPPPSVTQSVPNGGTEDTTDNASLPLDTTNIAEQTLAPTPVCSLTLYYRVGRAPSPQLVHETLSRLEEYNVAATVVPVCQLNHPNTFLTLCALRH